MALIPGGAPLAFTLVSLYLVGSGNVFAGVALFIWGAVELFIVDKTIRPSLVGGPIKLPFLLTFFGLIGEIGRATSELQSRPHLVCRLLLEKKKKAKCMCWT